MSIFAPSRFPSALPLAPPRPSRPSSPALARTTRLARATLAQFAWQDWLVLAYLLVLAGSVFAGGGSRRTMAALAVGADLAVYVASMLLVRGALLPSRIAANLVYRAALIGVVLASFLQLHWILPVASPGSYDAALVDFDLRAFGFEPALSWDRWVTPTTTEWFAFFYYSYFFILLGYLIPSALFERRTRVLGELSWGVLWIVCLGHALYLVVPGFGPYRHLGGHFRHELAGDFWWPLVRSAVQAVDGAARKDIFPSLHTALPTFLALFSFRNRRHAPFRHLWPVTAFFASQIIVATMFLRWHYLVDVVAGVLLASSAYLGARFVVPAELRRRSERGLEPVWTPLFHRGAKRRRRGACAVADAPKAGGARLAP